MMTFFSKFIAKTANKETTTTILAKDVEVTTEIREVEHKDKNEVDINAALLYAYGFPYFWI